MQMSKRIDYFCISSLWWKEGITLKTFNNILSISTFVRPSGCCGFIENLLPTNASVSNNVNVS